LVLSLYLLLLQDILPCPVHTRMAREVYYVHFACNIWVIPS
jgi:hypothetical protein